MRYTDSNSNSNATTVREQMNSVYVTRASDVPSEEINCFYNLVKFLTCKDCKIILQECNDIKVQMYILIK